ncbi:hypothetical protein FZEAL_2591 [Fusarium zealandicum]|uniref:Uncharacterized protein n=1 Tax=Fusarium zealandicum TaxID=1053134 RepID=A0A8H4UQF9_9HYPO|nr:hypothetical protein FZEAL_2591 [Fusarium zealandicum]
MNGTQSPESQKPPPANTNGNNSNSSSLAAKKRKKDGLKPIITMEGASPPSAIGGVARAVSTPTIQTLLRRPGTVSQRNLIGVDLALLRCHYEAAPTHNDGVKRFTSSLSRGVSTPAHGAVTIASHYRGQQRPVKQVETSVDACSLTGFPATVGRAFRRLEPCAWA